MRYVFFIILLLMLAGCNPHYLMGKPSGAAPVISTLRYIQPEMNGWEIVPAREGEWRRDGIVDLGLPQYFSQQDLRARDSRYPNYFHATYVLNKYIDIVLWVDIGAAFNKYRHTRQPMFIKDPVQEIFSDNKDSCRKLRVQGVAISFNIVDVDFDSGSVYYIHDGEKIEGVEKKDVPGWLVVPGVEYERAMHNLADPKTLRNRQVRASKPQGYSTFHYKFPMSCSDLENAILVVDGLYYHGKRLPPLKVRLNYINFNEVPQYTGNGVNQIRQ